ncbi:hypothetical protein [Pantoea eucalypti]|jgi:hypothetical protein|uniref:hypothetical protein n=1 Tax=Pantoea eucalypti TaxID=470933 RepID=UPI000999C20F|nr:hypothetical protein [Pantoea eucalypti]SKA19351.1 hypothetical protein SAMN03097723_3519 [Pantoea eucalypti]
MTEEQKQVLIEHAKSWIAASEAMRDEIPFGFDGDTEKELSLIKIALAALTAPPVKAPDTKCIGWVKDSIKEHDEKWRDAIRAAGYKVEDE